MTQNEVEEERNRFDRKPVSVFLSYYRPHLLLFIGDLICAFIVAIVETAFPLMSKYTLDQIIPSMNLRTLTIMGIVMVSLYVVRTVAYWFIDYWGHMFGTYVESDMRKDLFAHIERQSFSFFDKNRTGHIMSRVTNDLFDITELAHHGPEDIFISIATLIGSFIILLNIRWELALAIFIYVPLVIWNAIRSRKKLSKSSAKRKETTSEINATLEASISGARVTKVFTNEKYENDRFREGDKNFIGAKKMFYNAMSFFHAKLEFPLNLLNVLIIILGGYFIMKGQMTLSDLVAANLFISALMTPIRRLSNFVEQYTIGMAGFKRFLEIMQSHTETPEVPDARTITNAEGRIVYENVCFSYNDQVKVLEDINLTIEPGKTVALVGPSGSGKTTLCHLLPRFYELTSGRILLDGCDITSLTVESLRKQIGLVQQDVFLFAGTIKENIAYGRIGASDEDIIEAAKRAEIHEDIMKMPDGYDTIVGERGIKLSGGQKQRVSIARIFLKNPPILILDEATSALDTATELRIQHSFEELSKGRTTIVIAHRLSTVKNADMIAVVEGERISEADTHDELIKKGGVYKELYEAQYNRR